ncbi:MAG: Xaa-Pro peptidase family protein [Gemmataceae bacterium]|nr:Xaa-Pro peptidase family protein [Gemmataceae bacterium]
MNFLALRRQTLTRNLKAAGADAALVTASVNVTYLTGFTGDSSYLVLTPKAAVLVTDPRYEAQVLEECPDVGRDGAVDLHVRPHNRTTPEAAAEVLTKAGARAVAVEASRLTVAELEGLRGLAPKAEWVPVKGLVEALRAVKDPSEVEHIRAAVKVAERGFRMFAATLREADTEKDMADALDGWLRRAGSRGSPFPPIVAVGDRGARPHAVPSPDRPLGEGSKLLVDWGAETAGGYKADITRTLKSPFLPTPSRRNKFERAGYELEEVYAVVLAAQDAALATIRAGVPAREVDAAARQVIDGSKFAGCFTHGLGHGIGLEVHEAPRVRENSDDVLEAGMVITVEPGIYIPGEDGGPGWGGVRIEDDVLVTRDGHTRLTTLSRDLSVAGGGS